MTAQSFKLIKRFDIVAPNTLFNTSATGLIGHTFIFIFISK